MYTEIDKCRICGSKNLIKILSLGKQALTGKFPGSPNESITTGPLDLVWCKDSGLLQLKQSYNINEIFGRDYSYRSGLNQYMIKHLEHKIQSLEKKIYLSEDDLVIDIGSNDATSLKAYTSNCTKIGIDPSGAKFKDCYDKNMTLLPNFFSAELFKQHFGEQKAKIITSIAMLYNLESPMTFINDINEILAEDGIWHFEQNYMPCMLHMNAYDCLCHENLEFYSFQIIRKMLNSYDMQVLEAKLNEAKWRQPGNNRSEENRAI